MAINGNVAIKFNALYRLNRVPVRAVELSLPKVKVEFFSGRQCWVNGVKLTDY
jgi:hypothetical protein